MNLQCVDVDRVHTIQNPHSAISRVVCVSYFFGCVSGATIKRRDVNKNKNTNKSQPNEPLKLAANRDFERIFPSVSDRYDTKI